MFKTNFIKFFSTPNTDYLRKWSFLGKELLAMAVAMSSNFLGVIGVFCNILSTYLIRLIFTSPWFFKIIRSRFSLADTFITFDLTTFHSILQLFPHCHWLVNTVFFSFANRKTPSPISKSPFPLTHSGLTIFRTDWTRWMTRSILTLIPVYWRLCIKAAKYSVLTIFPPLRKLSYLTYGLVWPRNPLGVFRSHVLPIVNAL